MGSDVIVIGGGAIGLAVARDLAVDQSVVLLERGTPGQQASWAAAGMLCPHGEASDDDALFRLGLSSLGMYRSYVRGLLDETGVDAEYQDDGTLVLASTDDEWADLERRSAWQQAAGMDTSLIGPEEVRTREPRLTLDIHGALHCPTDHHVHPRCLLEALRKACVIRGVSIRSGVSADAILASKGRVTGVQSSGRRYDGASVVVAAGAWAGQLAGLDPIIRTRPRKGQILAVEMPRSAFRHVIRWRQFYLTPRRYGTLVVGATNEDSGFDRSLSVAGIRQLLDAAATMSGQVGAYSLEEMWTGLRPETSDGLPAIGPGAIDGLFYAIGHYRNGILLTPVTARIVGDAVRGLGLDPELSVFSPERFGEPESTAHASGPVPTRADV